MKWHTMGWLSQSERLITARFSSSCRVAQHLSRFRRTVECYGRMTARSEAGPPPKDFPD